MAIQNVYLEASDRAKQIVKDNIVIDTLNCVGMNQKLGWINDPEQSKLMLDYWDRAREAGVTAMAMTVQIDPARSEAAIHKIATHIDAINRFPEKYMLVRNTKDIEAAHATGKLGLYFTYQGSCLYDENPELVGVFRQLGIGYSLMAYNNRYRVGDGVYVPDNGGLTPWGKNIIDHQVRYGMPIDVTHTGIRCTGEVIQYVKDTHPGHPVIYSHTGLKRWVDHERAATDENAKALAETGGVMHVNLCNPVVSTDPQPEIKPEEHAGAIDCAVQFLGIDHVGIATDDFEDNGPFIALVMANQDKYDEKSLNDVRRGVNMFAELSKCLPAILDVLLEKGYSDEDCAKIIGGNTLRVLKHTWDRGVAK